MKLTECFMLGRHQFFISSSYLKLLVHGCVLMFHHCTSICFRSEGQLYSVTGPFSHTCYWVNWIGYEFSNVIWFYMYKIYSINCLVKVLFLIYFNWNFFFDRIWSQHWYLDQLCCQDYGYICFPIFNSSTSTNAQFNIRKALGSVDCSYYLCFNVHYLLPLPGAFSIS